MVDLTTELFANAAAARQLGLFDMATKFEGLAGSTIAPDRPVINFTGAKVGCDPKTGEQRDAVGNPGSIEEMTIYELIVLADQNFTAVNAVWVDARSHSDGDYTLADATIEWARQNGRTIRIKSSKIALASFAKINKFE